MKKLKVILVLLLLLGCNRATETPEPVTPPPKFVASYDVDELLEEMERAREIHLLYIELCLVDPKNEHCIYAGGLGWNIKWCETYDDVILALTDLKELQEVRE